MKIENVVFCDQSYRNVSGRDMVMIGGMKVGWTRIEDDGKIKNRRMEVMRGFKFGLATDKVCPFFMRVMRFILPEIRMFECTACHDALYATQGGKREDRFVDTEFDDVSREEADLVAKEILKKKRVQGWQRSIVYVFVRLFGKKAWDE